MTLEVAAVDQAATCLRSLAPVNPQVAVILGSGLGGLARAIEVEAFVDFTDLPHFLPATATGHRGRVFLGRWQGVPAIVFQGRLHGYEGHSPQHVALAVRVSRALGASTLVATNAAGGLNPHYRVGDLVLVDDHINFSFRNPLVGANDPAWGPRWPDMSRPYDPRLLELTSAAARQLGLACHRGVYVGMLGPTYETRAEYRMLRRLGGDVVGMSTVAEVIVARQLGMRTLGISVVSNECCPDKLSATSGEQVVGHVAQAGAKVGRLLAAVLPELGKRAVEAS